MERNKFGGVALIIGAFYFLGVQLKIIPDTSLVKILFSLWLLWIIIKSVPKMRFWGILIPIAILYKFWQEELNLVDISWFAIMGTTILLCIGLSLLFKKSLYTFVSLGGEAHKGYQKKDKSSESVVFGQRTEYFNCENLVEKSIEAVFSTNDIYFDRCEMLKEGATIHMDIIFGTVTLYIPSDWQVDIKLDEVFSKVNINEKPVNTCKTLLIEGDMVFSTLNVVYI